VANDTSIGVQSPTLINIFGRTDVGQSRDHNEDNFVVGSDIAHQKWTFRQEPIPLGKQGALLVVADGMGGTNAGEVASELAVNTIREEFEKLTETPKEADEIFGFMKNAIQAANQAILEYAKEHPECVGMGTTVVIAWILGINAYIAWVGDSRCYIYRKKNPFQPLTDDHSLIWSLVKKGKLTPEQARVHPDSNIITQSLGDRKNRPKPDTLEVALNKGDRILLCSDGLNSELSDAHIEKILQSHVAAPELCKRLVEAANAAGGHDNITVLVMDILEMPSTKTPLPFKRKKFRLPRLLPLPKLTKIALTALFIVLVAALSYWFYGRIHGERSEEPAKPEKKIPDANGNQEKPDSSAPNIEEEAPATSGEKPTSSQEEEKPKNPANQIPANSETAPPVPNGDASNSNQQNTPSVKAKKEKKDPNPENKAIDQATPDTQTASPNDNEDEKPSTEPSPKEDTIQELKPADERQPELQKITPKAVPTPLDSVKDPPVKSDSSQTKEKEPENNNQ